MLTIRLQRVGKAKRPVYRLIVSEKARDTKGTYAEQLGTFNPHDKVKGWAGNGERIKYWISKGASTSATVHNLLLKNGVITGDKKRSVFLSKKRVAKLAEKKKVAAPTPAPTPAPAA